MFPVDFGELPYVQFVRKVLLLEKWFTVFFLAWLYIFFSHTVFFAVTAFILFFLWFLQWRSYVALEKSVNLPVQSITLEY
jgi:hypothetical protein